MGAQVHDEFKCLTVGVLGINCSILRVCESLRGYSDRKLVRE